MRTVRLLTVLCRSFQRGGGGLPEGFLLRGVSAQGEEGCCLRGCLSGGCLPREVSAQEGVCLVGLCTGGVCLGGVYPGEGVSAWGCLPRGVCPGCVSQHAMGQTPSPREQNHRCKNITLSQTSFAGGNNLFSSVTKITTRSFGM